MRVLFWSHGFWPQIGGLEVFATNLLAALQERGCEFIVVTGDSNANQPWYKGIRIYRFPFRDIRSYTNIDRLMEIRQQMAKLKRTFEPDLVHLNGAADFGAEASDRFGPPLSRGHVD